MKIKFNYLKIKKSVPLGMKKRLSDKGSELVVLILRKKIADNPADLAKLSTETGGGEENRTPVRNRISANVYECMSPI